MGGKMSRNKGSRVERELVALLREDGWEAFRVPLSGAAQGFKGDVVASKGGKMLTFEVKARATMFDWVYDLLSEDGQATSILEGVSVGTYNKTYQWLATLHEKHAKRLLKYRADWLGSADILVIKGDRQPFLFITLKGDKEKLYEGDLSKSRS